MSPDPRSHLVDSGFTSAGLMNLVNEAALLAARRGRQTVGVGEFEQAKDTATTGAERCAHVMTDMERQHTAVREAGRAIVALHAPAADPVYKATIVTHGSTFGMVMQLPENDQVSMTFEQMTARLTVLMAGRAAEQLMFDRNQLTSGTADDIEKATKLTRLMVTRWGLSEELGAVTYSEDDEEVFLVHSVARQHNISEATAQIIVIEVRKLIDGAPVESAAHPGSICR